MVFWILDCTDFVGGITPIDFVDFADFLGGDYTDFYG